MNRIAMVAGLLALLTTSGMANLFVNGDFEQPLENGWKDSLNQITGSHRYERGDTLGQGSGHAAKVYKYLGYFASLSQTVPVPGVGLTLSFDARLRQGLGSSTCWPVAAFFVRYLNAEGRELGGTCYYNHSVYADWTESTTLNLIEVTSFDWNHYELNIADELAANLPGVNPTEVSRIRADLFAYDSGT